MMKSNVIYLFSFAVFLISCSEWEYPYPTPILEIGKIDETGVVLKASLEHSAIEEIETIHFEWNQKKSPYVIKSEKIAINTTTKNYQHKVIKGLRPVNADFEARAILTTKSGTEIIGSSSYFESLGCPKGTITLSYSEVFQGDTIEIYGDDHWCKELFDGIVINNRSAEIIELTDSGLTFIVPSLPEAYTYNMTVKFIGYHHYTALKYQQ